MGHPQGFDRRILTVQAHRPWPMPTRPWVMTQTWHDLLFAHWPVEPRAIRPLVPGRFDVDVFDGHAWVGVVPFRMSNVAARGMPAVPGLSGFCEVNVRTYVSVDGRPGVYFFSLDAASLLAVSAARLLLNLPYHAAAIALQYTGSHFVYSSVRKSSGAALHVAYRGCGDAVRAEHGSIEYFLTERYCLYATRRSQQPYRVDIHHLPWSLQAARAAFGRNELAAASGVTTPGTPPLLHFSRRQDVVTWAPTDLAASDGVDPADG